jgi:hypothetical protein
MNVILIKGNERIGLLETIQVYNSHDKTLRGTLCFIIDSSQVIFQRDVRLTLTREETLYTLHRSIFYNVREYHCNSIYYLLLRILWFILPHTHLQPRFLLFTTIYLNKGLTTQTHT